MATRTIRARSTRTASASVALTIALATWGFAQSTSVSGETRSLAVRYADGRTNYYVLRSTGGGSWTPLFPRVAGADTSRDGVPLAALDLALAVDDQEVVVTVSLLYGMPHQNRVTVAKVRVTQERPVRVDELTPYGVEAITLSIVPVSPALVYPLSVTCASAALDARIDPVAPDVPAYRMVIINLSPRALMAFDYEAYRGDDRILSGRRKGRRHEPLALPGAQHVFEMPVSRASAEPSATAQEWRPLDRLAISSVIWEDGTVEGDAEPAASERAVAAGSAKQLSRVLVLVRAGTETHRAMTPDGFRAAVEALPLVVSAEEAAAVRASLADPRITSAERVSQSIQVGMRLARDEVLRDLEAFQRAQPSGGAAAFGRWLTESAAEYENWLTRIARYVR